MDLFLLGGAQTIAGRMNFDRDQSKSGYGADYGFYRQDRTLIELGYASWGSGLVNHCSRRIREEARSVVKV